VRTVARGIIVPAPLPFNENHRLETLREYRILDTPSEVRFDRIVSHAALRCNVPIATFTIVDETRSWFKSRTGLDVQEIDRQNSFCAHTVASNAPLVIEDATQDERFADSEFVVGEPFIRFYAGVPVRARNQDALGSICIIDRKPRTLPWQDFQLLKRLANQIEVQLLLRKSRLDAH
tara:strand:- start:976 stop:1506 length:531 start_codon:yes stop_codon:yes gene_type:complete